MASVKFILISGPGAKPNQRQTELQKSDALSHAARVSHARRRHKREQADLRVLIETSSCTAYRDDNARDEEESQALITRPRNLLGQGKLDPFRVGQFEELPPVMHEGMEYVYEVLWPINSPALEGPALRNVITAWRTKAVASPLIFHSQVVNAATLCHVLSNNSSVKRELELVRLFHQTKAIRLVQEAINCLGNGVPSVALITCIMDMSVSGGQLLDEVPIESIPESPISRAFNFKHYGRFAAPRAHFDAVIDLVHRRGGIEELPPEVANPLQLADIDVAIRLIARPIFPLRLSLLQITREKKCRFDADAISLLDELGTGLLQPKHLIPNVKLRLLITQASNLTAAIDQNHRGAPEKLHLHELAQQSMVFQHRLLTLPPMSPKVEDEDSLGSNVDEHIGDIIRVTLMIYSSLVIFPSCPAARVKQRLAAMLRSRLLFLFGEHGASHDEFDDILLWTFILGGVACLDDLSNRACYVRQISSIVVRRGLSFENVENILCRFLYWPYVMAEEVVKLWNEVVECQRMVSPRVDSRIQHVDSLTSTCTSVARIRPVHRLRRANTVDSFHHDPSEGLLVALEVGAVLYDQDNIWGRPDVFPVQKRTNSRAK